MENIIVYCCLNTSTAVTTDGIDGLVEHMFDAITNGDGAPDTTDGIDGDGTLVVSWHDHVRAGLWWAHNLTTVAWLHPEWVQGMLGWHEPECEWLGSLDRQAGECEYVYRECIAGCALWFFNHDDATTCAHE